MTAAPTFDPSSAAKGRHGRLGCVSGAPMRLTVLGATGSIGASTLDLVAHAPDRFEIVALTAQSNAEKLASLAIRHRARRAVIGDPAAYGLLSYLLAGTGIEAAAGPEGLAEAGAMPADCVMAAIVGAAGLAPTFAAARQGTRVALANKECLVSAGTVFLDAIARNGAELLPVDSEHSAAFQAIGANAPEAIETIVLTASGGPFRTWSVDAIEAATASAALKHPNWSMGAKITIDSATLMNKGLELIEAFHLFPVTANQLGVLVHPQSIVHCLVTLKDGSVLAQLAPPDMRTPIALALAWPERMPTPVARLDLTKASTLTFEPPDETRFPALAIARGALLRGGTAPLVLNAANEVAVAAFLSGRIGFGDIARTVARTLEAAEGHGEIINATTLEEILALDRLARERAADALGKAPRHVAAATPSP